MRSALALRDYQEECITGIREAWAGGYRRPAAVLPTGAGKTVVFSNLGKRHIDEFNKQRVLVLVHTDELVRQAVDKFTMVAPDLSVGIVKGKVNEVSRNVVVASVQSLRNAKRRAELRAVGLIVVDECHHAAASTYRTILEHYGSFDGDCPVRTVGFTATLARGDNKSLADVWDTVAYKRDILFMIKRGYLLDVRGKRIEVPDFDLSNVKKRGGDYAEGDLGQALTDSMAPELVAKAYIEHAHDRAGLLFAPTVASAYVMMEGLRAEGITCEVVHGAQATNERRDVVRRFEAGEIQVIANCMALTEGFDSPRASCVVIARPTKSAPLYQQMVGRALRLFPGQTDALVLDVVGASRAHDLRSLIDLTDADVREETVDELTLSEAAEESERLEALEDEQASSELFDEMYNGPTEVKEFNPLVRDSKRAWHKTYGGTYFISGGNDVYVFLVPCQGTSVCKCDGDCRDAAGYTEACVDGRHPFTGKDYAQNCYACKDGVVECGEDLWDVAWCSKPSSLMYPVKTGGFTAHKSLPMEYAFAWGEDVAEELGGDTMDHFTGKSKRWRRDHPTVKQLRELERLGLTAPSGASGGDVSQLIEVEKGSDRIDKVVPRLVK